MTVILFQQGTPLVIPTSNALGGAKVAISLGISLALAISAFLIF